MTKIFVVDGRELPHPEDVAMLQALYSRSAASVEDHLDRVRKGGSSKFVENYVVGYGHRSIADCGTTTIFIEGVSLLAAKAVQDWSLYSGQETSTRYINMAEQKICDPVGTPESKSILDAWMSFYTANQNRVSEILMQRYPKREGEKADTYARAIKARTFDVLRGFLPAGITTQLSWHTNLRQAGDHLASLVNHPAAEVADLGRAIQKSRRAGAKRTETGPRYESKNPGAGCNATHVARSRAKWKRRAARSLRRNGKVTPKVQL